MNRHVGMSTAELLAVLDDIRQRVEAGDSFEGSIEYLMPEPLIDGGVTEPTLVEADFAVQASYRVGNLEGQGGLRLIRSPSGSAPGGRTRE